MPGKTPTDTWPAQVYGRWGNPPLVFLHGFLGAGEEWQFLVPAFQQRFYCVFLDLPGHGKNLTSLPEAPLSFAYLADGLRRSLDSLNLPAVHLVGYSLGGRLALYFATYYLQRVKSLTLESASPGLADWHERLARHAEDVRRATRLGEVDLAEFVDEWYRQPLFASLQRVPKMLADLRTRRSHNHPRALGRVIAELSPGQQPDLWGQLEQLSCPTLLLAGELDQKYSSLAQQMAERLPRAKVALAPKAGHNLHLEAPGWYIQQLSTFLNAA